MIRSLQQSKSVVAASVLNSLRSCSSFSEGSKFSCERKITSDDVSKYSQLTGDFNPVHQDVNGGRLVHGTLLLGLVSGLVASSIPGTILTNISCRFIHPCTIGSSLDIEIEVGEIRRLTKINFKVRNKEDEQSALIEGHVSCVLPKPLSIVG